MPAMSEATKMDQCKTCKHWTPDTYEPMVMPFEVRECKHPKLLFCERPVENPGFAVADGSTYFAGLFTAADFGCVMHEKAE